MADSPIHVYYGPAIDEALASHSQKLTKLAVEVSKHLHEAGDDAKLDDSKRALARLRAAIAAMYF